MLEVSQLKKLTKEDCEKMTQEKLRSECRLRGLPVSKHIPIVNDKGEKKTQPRHFTCDVMRAQLVEHSQQVFFSFR